MNRLIASVRADHFIEVALNLNGDEKIIVNDRSGVQGLIQRARHLKGGLFDFDGTLHTGNTWAAVGKRIPAELLAKDDAIRDWYWRQLHSQRGNSTKLDDPDWFLEHMDPRNQTVVEGSWAANTIHWYIQAAITRLDITAIASDLGEREGAPELLLMMNERAVITFGIEQIVQDWLHQRRIKAAVAGIRLTFDEQERIMGHHPNMVASPAKKLAAERFREITGLKEEEILVVGDSVVDVHMMRPGGFNVLLLPPGESEKKLRDFRENNLAAMWDRLTMILVSDSLMPLVDLLMMARL